MSRRTQCVRVFRRFLRAPRRSKISRHDERKGRRAKKKKTMCAKIEGTPLTFKGEKQQTCDVICLISACFLPLLSSTWHQAMSLTLLLTQRHPEHISTNQDSRYRIRMPPSCSDPTHIFNLDRALCSLLISKPREQHPSLHGQDTQHAGRLLTRLFTFSSFFLHPQTSSCYATFPSVPRPPHLITLPN